MSASRFLFVLPLMVCVACVNGPVRYKTAGSKQSVTRDACNQTYYPILVPLSVLADAGIVTADTFAVPSTTLWSIVRYPFGEERAQDTAIGLLVMPIYGPMIFVETCATLPFADRMDYQELFGNECSWMRSDEPKHYLRSDNSK